MLSVVQALGIAIFLERQTKIAGGAAAGLPTRASAFRLMAVLTLTTGTCFIMWLGEQITERGIGNGMSLIIYAGIVVGLPRAVLQTIEQMRTGQLGLLRILFLLVFMALVIAAIVFVERGAPAGHGPVRQAGRRAPHVRRVEHAHPAEGEHRRRDPGDLRLVDPGVPGDDRAGVPGASTPTPCRSSSASACRSTTCSMWSASSSSRTSTPRSSSTRMTWPRTCASYGGFVPGIRPGKRTAEYIDTILARITLAGAIYLALIAILPNFLISGFRVAPIPFIGEWLDRGAAEVHHGRLERAVLLRRHVAAHRGRAWRWIRCSRSSRS